MYNFKYLPQPVVHFPKNGAFRIGAVLLLVSSALSGEDLYSLFYGGNRPDVKTPAFYRIDYFLIEHEISHVLFGNHDSLAARKSLILTDVEEPLDLVVYPAYRLDFPFLADRPGYSDPLIYRDAGYGAQKNVEFSAGGTVAVDHPVALLERKRCSQGYGLVLGKPLPDEAAQ